MNLKRRKAMSVQRFASNCCQHEYDEESLDLGAFFLVVLACVQKK